MAPRSNQRKRVLSGMRSTGKLHLGNYVGALDNWVRMQDQYECFFFVADWHALTTDYADTSRIKENSVEVLMDWLAAGLDPGPLHHVHPVAHSAACRVAFAVLDDYAAGLAGACAHLQRAARKYFGKRPGHLWLPGLSVAAVRRHFDLQGRLRSGGRRSGAARGTDARSRAPLQHVLQPPGFAGLSRAAAAADACRESCPEPMAARCRSPTATPFC